MARSTVPPPPPAPDGDAGSPVPGSAAATPAARKPATKKSATATPAAQKSAASKPAAEQKAPEQKASAASTAPAAAGAAPSAPAASAPEALEPPRPNPYATPAVVTTPGTMPSPYAGAPAAQPATLSVLSLVFGVVGLVLSFFFVGLLPAIAGVITGHLALKREPHARGMAVGGLVTGYVGIAISVLWALIILVPLLLVWLAVGAVGITGGLTGGF